MWAQIVDGNIFANSFGRWELILADFREDPSGVPSFTNLRNITPAGARWIEPGNFAPDGKSLLITADIGLKRRARAWISTSWTSPPAAYAT